MVSPIFIVAATLGIAVALLVGSCSYKQAKTNRNDVAAVKACVFNPAYAGTTPEDQRQLFAQCLDDYRMAGK